MSSATNGIDWPVLYEDGLPSAEISLDELERIAFERLYVLCDERPFQLGPLHGAAISNALPTPNHRHESQADGLALFWHTRCQRGSHIDAWTSSHCRLL